MNEYDLLIYFLLLLVGFLLGDKFRAYWENHMKKIPRY